MLLMAVFDQYLKKYKYYGFKKKKNKFFYTDFFFASYMFMGLYWFLVIRVGGFLLPLYSDCL